MSRSSSELELVNPPGPVHWTNPRWMLELFVVFNLAFLALDIYLAHASNRFAMVEEWIPVGFSLVTPLVLLGGLLPGRFGGPVWRIGGILVGILAVVLGYAGVFYHLGSAFFQELTLRSLVYSAPFAAPLSYAGLGFLLLLNRYQLELLAWARWVLLLSGGGFAGNFLICLGDHAQNGFFSQSEWLPVYCSAFALSFVLLLVLRPYDDLLRRSCYWVIGAQVLVGVLGAVLHLLADLAKVDQGLSQGLVYGAPLFAPLLLADVALLCGLGLWALRCSASHSATSDSVPLYSPN